MSQTCPTVKVKSDAAEQGFIVINEADFVDDLHELFDPADSSGDRVQTIGQVRDALTARGIEFDPKGRKADLAALLAAAP